MNKFAIWALTLTGATLAATPAFAQQAAAPSGNVEQGKALYVQVGCFACHGLAGQGALATGPRLSRTQLPFSSFVAVLRRPLKQMPPYEAAVLPDQDVADIFAYVRQLPEPRDPKSIALLK
jgi:mono/diheme cytochrome c family protein